MGMENSEDERSVLASSPETPFSDTGYEGEGSDSTDNGIMIVAKRTARAFRPDLFMPLSVRFGTSLQALMTKTASSCFSSETNTKPFPKRALPEDLKPLKTRVFFLRFFEEKWCL
ncbi:unnamed protein product [Gongylonema pulchrum]|uniref:Uncharacterized protein n=1 Tax=Gongylonema pulchrum TaxID=637853 RepID=A0A183DNI7_9BILA|nr:unnamed protein product [Gongylonema pulchrum]